MEYKGGSTPGMNQALGLPFGEGMQNVAVCFDMDGTLIDNEHDIESTQALLLAFLWQPWKNVDVIIWSGGGAAYAETNARRFLSNGFIARVKFYSKLQYKEIQAKYDKIIAFDDIQDTRLGDANLIVRNK